MKSEQKECFAALNIGCTYLTLEKWTDADKYFQYALKLAIKDDLKRPEAYILSCLSDVYRELKQFDKSKKYVTEALQKKDALTESEQLEIYLAAIKLSVATGDQKQFVNLFDTYIEKFTKIQSSENQEKMSELEIKYETEKKRIPY